MNLYGELCTGVMYIRSTFGIGYGVACCMLFGVHAGLFDVNESEVSISQGAVSWRMDHD